MKLEPCIFNIRIRINFVLQSGNPCRLGCRESHSVRGGGGGGVIDPVISQPNYFADLQNSKLI